MTERVVIFSNIDSEGKIQIRFENRTYNACEGMFDTLSTGPFYKAKLHAKFPDQMSESETSLVGKEITEIRFLPFSGSGVPLKENEVKADETTNLMGPVIFLSDDVMIFSSYEDGSPGPIYTTRYDEPGPLCFDPPCTTHEENKATRSSDPMCYGPEFWHRHPIGK